MALRLHHRSHRLPHAIPDPLTKQLQLFATPYSLVPIPCPYAARHKKAPPHRPHDLRHRSRRRPPDPHHLRRSRPPGPTHQLRLALSHAGHRLPPHRLPHPLPPPHNPLPTPPPLTFPILTPPLPSSPP